jgi:hypothetical protein
VSGDQRKSERELKFGIELPLAIFVKHVNTDRLCGRRQHGNAATWHYGNDLVVFVLSTQPYPPMMRSVYKEFPDPSIRDAK